LSTCKIIQFVLLFISPATILATEPSVTFYAEPVTTNFYLIRAKGQPLHDNVLAFIGKDGILLVDCAYQETEKQLKNTLREISPLPVKYLINTHYHHAGANAAFSDSIIVAHENVRTRMQKKTMMYGAMPAGPWDELALPKQTFKDEMTIHFNGETIRLMHFSNVHTDGDTVVFFENSKVIATGDFYVPMLGPCDHANGCEWKAYVQGAKRLSTLAKSDSKLAPGHGPLSSHSDLLEFSKMLSEVTDFVQSKFNAGVKLDEIKAEGLPQPWQKWSERGIESDFFISNLYDGLTGSGSSNK
jgi:glyoxylase-like metal-dependent hydrolase (beta-lactamase superfamily II)